MITPADLARAFPEGGLFAGKDWLQSPEPFVLTETQWNEISKMGHRLQVFLRACNEFYYRSTRRKLPPWVAQYADAGKPAELLELAADKALRAALPGVIRPDLLVTEEGFALTEIDSVPGGIGLTAWLSQTYARLNPAWEIAGGANGMTEGFRSLFPQGADVVVSREAGDYRPEMEWLCAQLGGEFSVETAESYAPRGRDIYRFFELFDLPNIPGWHAMQQAAIRGELRISAPMKPWLEEKLWLALFHSRPLREAWRMELRENQQTALARMIPRGWVVDPAPLPHHAVLPHLDASCWEDVAAFSQKQRQLVLKLSGFNERAWGSRSVVIGQDTPQADWAAAVRQACTDFPQSPWVMQEFSQTSLVEHPYFDPATGTIRRMQGRVRLCPYFFAPDGQPPKLGGILATIVPADKKIVHGMKDGIIVPCRRETRE